VKENEMKKSIRMLSSLALAAVASLALASGTHAETGKSDPAAAAENAAYADIEKTLGFVPAFFKEIPAIALPGTWEEMKGLQVNDKTAIPCKYKELIGLAVAAQIPCQYCIEGHTTFAKLSGASKEEVGEAVVMAGLARHWSTFMNGIQLDEAKFRAEIKQVTENIKKAIASGAQPPAPINVVDAKSALADATQNFGFAPEFLKRFPESGLVGAYKAMRDVEMNPATALPGKYKSLIGLAVAAQIPCKYCIIADTDFAKLEGATDAEINEAIAMASLTREFSTLLNGLQVDLPRYRADLARIAKSMAAGPQAAKKSTAKSH